MQNIHLSESENPLYTLSKGHEASSQASVNAGARNFKMNPSEGLRANYLDISDDALVRIRQIISSRPESCSGIRVSVKSSGCSGLSYKIEYAVSGKNISEFDDVIIKDGISIFIDPKASIFLIGSRMIYIEDDLKSGFDFINPNEKGRCGCGESFKV